MKFQGADLGEIIVNTQLVLPPSIHPETGKEYKYVGYMSLGNSYKSDELMEIPELTMAHFNGFEEKLAGEKFEMADLHKIVGRNDKMKTLTGGLITQGLQVDEIARRIYLADLAMHANHESGPLFSDVKEFRELAKQPMACAYRFVSSVFNTSMRQIVLRGEAIPQFAGVELAAQEEGEFFVFKQFFDKKLANCKKDIISKRFLRWDGQQWQPVMENLDALKSYAIDQSLGPHKVAPHLDRYIMNQKEQMLIGISDWDGVDRIEQLRGFMKFKNQEFSIFEDAFKEWGANIFRRLFDDGAQNRCIILKGGQGLGKDTLIKSLLKAFGPYYAKFSSNRDERECWTQVTSRLVLHIEEFDQTGQLTIAFLKDLITRDWVTYRAPYGRDAMNRKCVGSFISTVNIDAVLRDETGNRRFAVFDLESIDWSYPKDWAPQIMAQFYDLYKKGYLAQAETWTSVTEGNEAFEQVDMSPEYIELWDDRVGKISDARGLVEFKYSEVHGVIDELCRMSKWSTKAICTLLKTHNRSRHSMSGTLYWSALKKIVSK